MGKRGGKRVSTSVVLFSKAVSSPFSLQGRGGARGGGRGSGQRPIRTDYSEVPKANAKYEEYYNELGLVEEPEREEFWTALRRELPNSFRFTGSKGYRSSYEYRWAHADCLNPLGKLYRCSNY